MSGRAEQELREIVGERVAAIAAKDPAPLAARQASDVVTFDVLAPLRSRGSDAVEESCRRIDEATPATTDGIARQIQQASASRLEFHSCSETTAVGMVIGLLFVGFRRWS